MYHYHDINEDDFEKIVVAICKELLGMATTGFAKGPDGGRDAKFTGRANEYPSKSSLWKGVTIIQAKHTSGINKEFGEPDFFSKKSENCIVAKEVKKIIKLIKSDGLKNYMLFSNRKMSANTDLKIKSYIKEKTGLDSSNVAILGIEELNFYMHKYPYIIDIGNLSPLTRAPIISCDELSVVISAFSKTFTDNKQDIQNMANIERTFFEEKNRLNNMSDDFAEYLEKNYLSSVKQISSFLDDPQNDDILELYRESIEEFQLNFIIPKQRKVQYFDEIFNELVALLINRNLVLRQNKRLTRIMVFYMYWNCDIGKGKND